MTPAVAVKSFMLWPWIEVAWRAQASQSLGADARFDGGAGRTKPARQQTLTYAECDCKKRDIRTSNQPRYQPPVANRDPGMAAPANSLRAISSPERAI